MRIYQHQRTTNDTNGNPRRLFVEYEIPEDGYRDPGYIAVHEEGYRGRPEHLRPLPELPAVDITPRAYRDLVTLAKSEGIYHRG